MPLELDELEVPDEDEVLEVLEEELEEVLLELLDELELLEESMGPLLAGPPLSEPPLSHPESVKNEAKRKPSTHIGAKRTKNTVDTPTIWSFMHLLNSAHSHQKCTSRSKASSVTDPSSHTECPPLLRIEHPGEAIGISGYMSGTSPEGSFINGHSCKCPHGAI
jgi:hypothetical protein